MKIPFPTINWANWPTWSAYGVVFMGGFVSGGISATNPPSFMARYVPQKQIQVASKEVKTIPVDVRAVVACTAALAATENLRSDFAKVCAPKPAAKAAVAK